jgi:AAA+ superfamily predicted ATPase
MLANSNTQHTIVMLLLLFSQLSHGNQNSYVPVAPRCEVPGMVGQCHADICNIIKRLLKEEEIIQSGATPSAKSEEKNILLLEGPTGTGKTTMAEAIASNTNSHFVKIHAPQLLNRYIGGTTTALIEKIGSAMAEGKALNKRVVILIDEIDKIAVDEKSNEISIARNEYDAAITALWCQIDDNQYKPEVFFIFTTNRFNSLPLPFKNRIGSNIISMNNPDALQRKELLYEFAKTETQQNLGAYCSEKDINTVVKETENFSVRDMQDLCHTARKYASHEDTPVAAKHIMYALKTKKANVALQHAPSEEELEKQRALKRQNEQEQIQRKTLELQQKSLEIQQKNLTLQEEMLKAQQQSVDLQDSSYRVLRDDNDRKTRQYWSS